MEFNFHATKSEMSTLKDGNFNFYTIFGRNISSYVHKRITLPFKYPFANVPISAPKSQGIMKFIARARRVTASI